MDVEEVSPETLRKRRDCIRHTIQHNFGENGDDYFIAEIIRLKGKEEREVLLKEMGLGGEMTKQEGLAMLVDLGTTWNMFRKLKKYVSFYCCVFW
jgi:hypothetical protein